MNIPVYIHMYCPALPVGVSEYIHRQTNNGIGNWKLTRNHPHLTFHVYESYISVYDHVLHRGGGVQQRLFIPKKQELRQ